jgi:omega-6 fatty acid desaturase (delta-12 desaturase)
VVGWSALAGVHTFLLIQGTTLVLGGAVGAWMLFVQHQYEETYYRAGDEWEFELAALLRAAHEEQEIFRRTPVVTLRSGIAALRLKLWDEERGRLVGVTALAWRNFTLRRL